MAISSDSARSQIGFNKLSAFVDALQAEGRYTFRREDALAMMRVSAEALKKAAARLIAVKRLAMPKRGFYVIVPLEYRSAGAPPPSWFIGELMERLGRRYYVGLLSAAALHGAAPQQPQEFQIVTEGPERPIVAGRGRIRFVVKNHLERSLTEERKTETGTMRVSTPETTALDLVRYAAAAAGLDNVAAVLAELSEKLRPRRLVDAARLDGERANTQRLGYLLSQVGAGGIIEPLATWLRSARPRPVPLRPGVSVRGCTVDRRWEVIVNASIEADR